MALTAEQIAQQRALIALKKLSGKSQTDQDNIVAMEALPGGISNSYQTIFASIIPGTPLISAGNDLVDGGDGGITLANGTNQDALNTKFSTDTTGTVMYVRLPLVKIISTDEGGGKYTGWTVHLPDEDNTDGAGASGKNFQALAALGDNYSLVQSKITDASKGFTDGSTVASSAGKVQFVPPSFGTKNADGVNPYDVRLWKASTYAKKQAGTDDGVWAHPADSMEWFFDYFSGVLFIGDASDSTYEDASDDFAGGDPVEFFIEGCIFVGSYLIDKDTSDPNAPGELAKQKLFNAYTFNETATFLEYSGSSWENADQPSSYWKVPTSCILGSEMIHVNGLLQDSSSRGIGENSGEVNDYLIYESGSNWLTPTGSETVIEFSYRAKDGSGNPHHDAKVKITYLQKDQS